MKRFLKNKKGITLLEGLIALTLLALVATGTFAVLLSTSRKSTGPDIQEEMALAIEKANKLLQAYVRQPFTDIDVNVLPPNGLCNFDDEGGPLALGKHDITCLLPPICDRSVYNHLEEGGGRQLFWYTISDPDLYEPKISGLVPADYTNRPYYLLYMSNNSSTIGDRLESEGANLPERTTALRGDYLKNSAGVAVQPSIKRIHFHIECNGFTL